MMDISDVGLKLTEMMEQSKEYITQLDISDRDIWIGVCVTIICVVMTTLHFLFRRMKSKAIRVPEMEQNRQLKFRKRDKVQFFARKVLRKGKDTANRLQRQVTMIKEGVSLPEFSRSGRKLRKRERMLILAKRMFRVKQDPPTLLKKELPSSMLEADLLEEQSPNLPEEVMYLLQSVKVFGHFEKGIFLQLCRHMEIVKVEKGKYLFRVGEPDEYIYVVQEGQINLYIEEGGLEVKLSEITVGESLHSLLSILDVLTGHSAPYKTVFARAVVDSSVIRLPVEAFNVAFENRKDALVQMVQVVMTRMQRVTFLALHNYLGLSHELLNPNKNLGGERLSVHKLSTSFDNEGGLRIDATASDVFRSQYSQDSDDVPDGTTTGMKRTDIKFNPQATKSHPTLSEQGKQLRFGEYDTVIDDNENVFHRQSSLPIRGEHLKMKETLKRAARHESIDEFEEMEIFPNHRDSIALSALKKESKLSEDGELVLEEQSVIELNEPEILELVIQDMMTLLGVENAELLSDKVTLLKVPQAYELIQEGDQDVSLYFVVTGALCVYQMQQGAGEESQNVTLFTAFPGYITGQLAVLTGEPSFFSVKASKDSVIAKIKRKALYSLLHQYPGIVLNLAHTVVQRVSRFVRQIDFALDWTMVEAGKALYRQGTQSDCMYIVLHGRLRAVHEWASKKKELVSEYGRGELVGMMEALRGTKRSVSMHAVRDTELAKMPEGLLKHIRRRHPGVVSHLVSLMSDKLLGTVLAQRPTSRNHPGELIRHKHQMAEETSFAYGDVSNHLANLSTVAVLPVNRSVPAVKFAMELEHALGAICDPVLRLDSDMIKRRLGQNAFDSTHEYRLSNWLAQQEDLHRMVIYQMDGHMTPWTQRCIRQSDAILIVAMGDDEPTLGSLEMKLESHSVRALKVLVILHRPEVSQPSRTVEWLNMRGWLTEHLHIKGSKRLFARTRRSKLNEYREKLSHREVDRFSDFSRLARFLTGTSIAVVFGGGGARGLSQIGIIKCLLEAGVPIDMVGGTSIGAFMGALWAGHRDLSIMRSQTAIFSSQMSSVFSKIFDLTYPVTSMFSGASFNREIHMIFKDVQIEDLWLPYFTITTDITCPKMRVHTDGSLWRYIRASMSLSGYLPPICDPKDGHMLMDGGYINNLPADVARSRGARRVIAVDVGAATDSDFTNYGDHLSGWWLLWKKWTGRWTGQIKVPDLNEIQSRLSYISCHYLMDLVINSDYCTYLRPPVTMYNTLDFNKWQEILDVGYKYGCEVFTEEWTMRFWRDLQNQASDQGTGAGSTDFTKVQNKSSISNLKANTSFTDLSEIVKGKVQGEMLRSQADISDIEFEIGYESSPEAGQGGRVLKRMMSEPMSEPDLDDEIISDLDAMRSRNDLISSSEDEDDIDTMRRFSSQNVLSSSL